MTLDANTLLLVIAGILTVLGILLIYSLFFSHSSSKENEPSEVLEHNKEITDAAYAKAMQVLSDSRAEAIKVVDEANKKALELLQNVQVNSETSVKMLDQKLSQASEDIVSSYKKELSFEVAKGLEQLTIAAQSMQQDIQKEVSSFGESLHKETVDSQAMLDKKINDEFSKLSDELKAYRETQMKSIDSQVHNVLVEVSKKVLGQALSLTDHQNLVVKALEEAKSRNLFTV